MVTVANFTSVFEVGVAINALFYLFDAVPRTHEAVQHLFDDHEKARKRKVELTQNSESFPIGLVVGELYSLGHAVLLFLSILMSLVSIGMLIWPAFDPEAQLSTAWMIAVLVPVLSIAPIGSLILYLVIATVVNQSRNWLDEQVSECYAKRYRDADSSTEVPSDGNLEMPTTPPPDVPMQ